MSLPKNYEDLERDPQYNVPDTDIRNMLGKFNAAKDAADRELERAVKIKEEADKAAFVNGEWRRFGPGILKAHNSLTFGAFYIVSRVADNGDILCKPYLAELRPDGVHWTFSDDRHPLELSDPTLMIWL